MTRLTVTIPDDLADKIRQAGSGNVSAWFQEAARDRLLREEVAAVAAFEAAADRSDGWDAEREAEWAA